MRKKFISMILFISVLFLGMGFVSAKAITPEDIVTAVKSNDLYEWTSSTCVGGWDVRYDSQNKKIISQCSVSNDYTSVIEGLYDEDENEIHFVHSANKNDDNITADIFLESIIINSIGSLYGYSSEELDAIFNEENQNVYTFARDGVEFEWFIWSPPNGQQGNSVMGPMNIKVNLNGGFGPKKETVYETITPEEYVSYI